MPWRGPKTAASRDPLLHSTAWRRTIRQHWQRLRLPCARCRRPIDYDGPQYLVVRGRKKQNPRYLVVGHIVSRYEAKRRGWTEQQINSLTNTQPECVACSNRSGAQLGQRVQRATLSSSQRLDTSRRW